MIGDNVKIRCKDNGYILPKSGLFSTGGLTKKGYSHRRQFNHCREVFAHKFKYDTNYIIFSQAGLDIELINDFFEKIEDKLKINKTIFHPTEFKTSVLIELSPFWKENSLRRGMFTLFLRCAACYYNGDIYKALLKYSLSKKIIGPIEWFMKGNTKTSRSIGGGSIVNELSSFGKKDWETALVK
jgi:hypothetical protein